MTGNELEIAAIALNLLRQAGKTYELATMCKRQDWTLICQTQGYAKEVEKEYGCKTLSRGHNLMGQTGPFVYDHHAMSQILYQGAWRVNALEHENNKLKNTLFKIEGALQLGKMGGNGE